MRPRTASTVTPRISEASATVTRLGSLRPVCDWSSPTPLCSTLRRPRASTSSFIPVSYYRDCKRVSNLDREPSGYASQPGPSPRKAASTGSGVTYRGARQVLPGCPTSVFVRLSATRDGNPHKQAEIHPCSTLREPTGVPDKRYRGAQQVLPGCPTNITGVPDKRYRGAQQVLPGRPTNITGVPNKPPLQNMLQNGTFCLCSEGPFVIVSLVVLCCLNNNYKENGEGYPWGPIASS
jgi:hypothetical protein